MTSLWWRSRCVVALAQSQTHDKDEADVFYGRDMYHLEMNTALSPSKASEANQGTNNDVDVARDARLPLALPRTCNVTGEDLDLDKSWSTLGEEEPDTLSSEDPEARLRHLRSILYDDQNDGTASQAPRQEEQKQVTPNKNPSKKIKEEDTLSSMDPEARLQHLRSLREEKLQNVRSLLYNKRQCRMAGECQEEEQVTAEKISNDKQKGDEEDLSSEDPDALVRYLRSLFYTDQHGQAPSQEKAPGEKPPKEKKKKRRKKTKHKRHDVKPTIPEVIDILPRSSYSVPSPSEEEQYRQRQNLDMPQKPFYRRTQSDPCHGISHDSQKLSSPVEDGWKESDSFSESARSNQLYTGDSKLKAEVLQTSTAEPIFPTTEAYLKFLEDQFVNMEVFSEASFSQQQDMLLKEEEEYAEVASTPEELIGLECLDETSDEAKGNAQWWKDDGSIDSFPVKTRFDYIDEEGNVWSPFGRVSSIATEPASEPQVQNEQTCETDSASISVSSPRGADSLEKSRRADSLKDRPYTGGEYELAPGGLLPGERSLEEQLASLTLAQRACVFALKTKWEEEEDEEKAYPEAFYLRFARCCPGRPFDYPAALKAMRRFPHRYLQTSICNMTNQLLTKVRR